MAIKIKTFKCPSCGATLNIEEDRKQFFCSYCGEKIFIYNDNEHIYRHIDEAKIKEIEYEERKREDEKRMTYLKIKISLILSGIGLFMMVVGWLIGSFSGDNNSPFYMIHVLGYFPLMAVAYIWIQQKKKNK